MIDQTLLEPKEILISGKRFLLSKLPATVGRETLLAYAYTMNSNESGVVDYSKVPLNNSMRLLSYASVAVGEAWMRLSTEEIINAHLSSINDYMDLEQKMLEHSMVFSSTAKS